MRRFLVLGPLEVLVDGVPVEIGGGRARALLARLLIQAPEPVLPEQLIEDLWGDRAPASAAKLVQGYVSDLRRRLGADAIRTSAAGYAIAADERDVEEFERLVRMAQMQGSSPQKAAGALRDAQGLWRGRPFAEVAYEPWAQVEVARLDELRLVATEDLLAARLRLGGSAELVPELEAVVAENPLRERAWSQLMLALYRCGRQAEALDAYKRARERLVEGLGIEPSRSLRELEQAILRQDRELDPVDVENARLPGRDFVGRRQELSELLGAFDQASEGRGRLILLQGEPGIGKTRLADELTELARARGAEVVVGRCWEAGGAPPFWPWMQLLRPLVVDPEGARSRRPLGAEAADLVYLIPELKKLFPQLPEQVSLDSDGARFRLFGAVARFLRDASRERPVVLFLDDMHAADQPSLLLLQFVARDLGDSRLLLVVAYRDVAPAISEPFADVLADLVREPRTRRITLRGLSTEEVRHYVALTSGGHASDELVTAIAAETEGNPFFVGEIVRLLVSEGPIGDAHSASIVVPQSVREVIGRRLRRLPDSCVNLLASASVLGREFAIDELARVARLPQPRVLNQLHEAVVERVLVETQGRPGRIAFTHALIRDTLYQGLTAVRRASLHRQAGEALQQIYAHDIDDHLAELAHHFAAAIPAGTLDEAVDYARRAGDRAARILAFEEAVRLYDTALRFTREERLQALLLERRARIVQLQGRLTEARDAFEQAVTLYRRRNDTTDAGRVLTGLSNVLWRIGDPHKDVPLSEALALLEAAPPTAELVGAYSELAGQRALEAAHTEAIEAAERALELADALALPEPERALGYRGQARAALGARNGLDEMRQALTLAIEHGHDRAAAVLHNNLAEATWLYDGPEAALEASTEGIEFCRQRGIGEWAHYLAATNLTFLASLGRIDQTSRESERLANYAQEHHDLPVLIESRSHQLRLSAEQDRGESAPVGADEIVRNSYDSGEPYLIVIGLAAGAGLLTTQHESEEAHALLILLSELPHLHDHPRYLTLLPGVTRTALEIGDYNLARQLTTSVQARTPLAENAHHSVAALIAEADDDHHGASSLFAESAERWQQFPNVPEHAYALLGRGRTMIASGQANADVPLLEARRLFDSMGYQTAIDTVEALLPRTRAHTP
jgi:DNA-binding SARP family transcriptional activator